MGKCSKLAIVQRLIDIGSPSAALLIANNLGEQFNSTTLNRWRNEGQGPRATYAWLVKAQKEAAG